MAKKYGSDEDGRTWTETGAATWISPPPADDGSDRRELWIAGVHVATVEGDPLRVGQRYGERTGYAIRLELAELEMGARPSWQQISRAIRGLFGE